MLCFLVRLFLTFQHLHRLAHLNIHNSSLRLKNNLFLTNFAQFLSIPIGHRHNLVEKNQLSIDTFKFHSHLFCHMTLHGISLLDRFENPLDSLYALGKNANCHVFLLTFHSYR